MRILDSLAVAAVLTVLAGSGHPGAVAQQQEWKDPAQVRLIDGGVLASGPQRLAGLEVMLEPGWKTYWRYPGDSGIPPHLDFSASGNLKAAEVEWPAPEMHWDGYAWVIGYTDVVVLPLVITPEDPDLPVDLRVALAYGVCKEICIPAEADEALLLDGKSARPSAIAFYRDRVPERIEAPTDRGGVETVTVTQEGEAPVLELRIRMPGDPGDAYAIVEGPDGWYLPVPERSETDPDLYRVSLDGAPGPEAISGAQIRVTGVSPTFSFEQLLTLD